MSFACCNLVGVDAKTSEEGGGGRGGGREREREGGIHRKPILAHGIVG